MRIHESRPDQVEQVYEHSKVGLANSRLPCDHCETMLETDETTPQITVHVTAEPEPSNDVICPSETSLVGVFCTECDVRTLEDSPIDKQEPTQDEYLLAARVVDGYLSNVRAVERQAPDERPAPIAYNAKDYDRQESYWHR